MRKLKTALTLLLTLGLAVLLSTAALADDAPSGTCGENVTWTLEGSVLTISGTGAMTDYSLYYNWIDAPYSDAPWYSSRENIALVVIENGVTSIGDSAFYCCTGLTSVTIPDSITSIGDESFMGCSSLTRVTIPGNVARIAVDAFCGCNSLTNVTISTGTISIIESAFAECSSLQCITIPTSMVSIDWYAFFGCVSLTDVYYGGSEDEWNAIAIEDEGNEYLLNATIHFASDSTDTGTDTDSTDTGSTDTGSTDTGNTDTGRALRKS
ncbi:MAG: leucine-rich repeat domain-containing protein [Oscillospiraceae bacterium]|nr:leucine-rich repeat domain-containing protein [Oscillospiraceae bacterium]